MVLAVFRTMIGTHLVLFSAVLGFMSDSQDAQLDIKLVEGAPLSHCSQTSVDTSLPRANGTKYEWEALPVQVHQKFANIVIRR